MVNFLTDTLLRSILVIKVCKRLAGIVHHPNGFLIVRDTGISSLMSSTLNLVVGVEKLTASIICNILLNVSTLWKLENSKRQKTANHYCSSRSNPIYQL